METFWKRLYRWCKKEIVLTIAFVLAIASAFLVPPDMEYLHYVDFRTLAILFCLMAVMAGLQKCGVFSYVAERLLQRVKHVRAMALILILLCFFSSMLITNDVALITFVPFAFIMLRLVFPQGADELIIPIVAMQTIAANLGSMLTPIGNPQNLYLYGRSGLGLASFLGLMLPYTLIALVLLVLWCCTFRYRGEARVELELKEQTSLAGCTKQIIIYGVLFLISLLTVAHVVPYGVALAVTILVIFGVDREVLRRVDYALLLTFVGFFLFIGNMGRIPAFYALLRQVIAGNEVLTAVVSSQVMSNVPAALLLSGFSDAWDQLIIGTNLGGLGTIIASMASLISFKYIGREQKTLRGRYLLWFTGANLLFLAVLLAVWLLL